MANDIVNYQDVITDIKGIISSGREVAYNAANKAMVLTYWHVGKRIVEQEQAGKERAKYGQALIEALADELTKEYGKSYSKRNLQYFRKFYLAFPDEQIVNACVHNLNWTHFRALLRVSDENARMWYMNEAAQEGWSSRTLDRNISTQYYYRLMQSPRKDAVKNEMLQKTAENQRNKFELLKSPIVAEFLGMMTLGWTDGCSFIPINFSLLASSKKEKILGEVKSYDRRSIAGKRRIMAQSKGTDVMIQLIDAAMKAGHKAKYVLFDSWFSNPHQIVELKDKGLDTIAMVKVSSRISYEFDGERRNIKQIYNSCKKRRGRSRYLLSVPVKVGQDQKDGHSVDARIVCVKNRANRKDWLALICTDMSLSEEEIIRIYGKRWDIMQISA